MNNPPRVIHARSPLRIDLVGMTDYVPACQEFGGSIVNATINKYLYATIRTRRDDQIVLHAPDHDDLCVQVESPQHLDPQGPLGLAQEILRRFDLTEGLELTTYSEMPAGAGLGSSSTIATCIIATLDALSGYRLSNYDMAELARDCETVALHTTYGWQDQYSPVTGGGVKYMRYWPADSGRGIEVDRLQLSLGLTAQLEKSLVVVFSGISRPAKSILDAVATGFQSGDPTVINALKAMSECADRIRLCLLRGDLSSLGDLLSEAWERHKQLHPDVTNDRIDHLYDVAKEAGALGGRICGAGGGGTMIFFCAPDKDYVVKSALRAAEATIFDCSIDHQGILLW